MAVLTAGKCAQDENADVSADTLDEAYSENWQSQKAIPNLSIDIYLQVQSFGKMMLLAPALQKKLRRSAAELLHDSKGLNLQLAMLEWKSIIRNFSTLPGCRLRT